MRINKYVALSSNLSRRAADQAIKDGRITVNGIVASPGQNITTQDELKIDGLVLKLSELCTIMLHKPIGFVVSRNGQGKPTIYDLLPKQYQHLQPVGRLDMDSSGLLLLTNDGQLAQELTHPSFNKIKRYDVVLNKPLLPTDQFKLKQGVPLNDGISHLQLNGSGNKWQISMAEGRNRQIRRTFEQIGYQVKTLHRTTFGPYDLGALAVGKWQTINKTDII
ncbi:MAG: pseudouridine synthase [Candidatus Saccharimonadales bacterium]|jgi:23S rRNA pseudouridine2605 synthase